MPALLGLPDGVWVLTSRIWRALERLPADYGEAGAYALGLMAIIALGVWLYWRTVRYGGGLGGGARPRRLPLGRWRAPLAALVLGTLVVLVVLPAGDDPLHVAAAALRCALTFEGFNRLEVDAYATLADDDVSLAALRNSLLLAAGSATAASLLTLTAAWLVVRAKVRGRQAMDFAVSVPLAIPGLVLGAALLFVYLRAPLPDLRHVVDPADRLRDPGIALRDAIRRRRSGPGRHQPRGGGTGQRCGPLAASPAGAGASGAPGARRRVGLPRDQRDARPRCVGGARRPRHRGDRGADLRAVRVGTIPTDGRLGGGRAARGGPARDRRGPGVSPLCPAAGATRRG